MINGSTYDIKVTNKDNPKIFSTNSLIENRSKEFNTRTRTTRHNIAIKIAIKKVIYGENPNLKKKYDKGKLSNKIPPTHS